MSIYHRRVFLKPKSNKKQPWMKQLQVAQIKSQEQQNQKKQKANLKLRLISCYQNQIVGIFMAILTIWTIFAIDIDKAFFNVQASLYFSTIHSFAIGLFTLEIFLLSYTKKQEYFLKFYFWIDIFSTLTMFLELIWIENLMSTNSDVAVAISFAKVTKASRLSKIGARSTKIMKLIRLIRLIKVFNKEKDSAKDGIKQNQDQIINENDQINKKDLQEIQIDDQQMIQQITNEEQSSNTSQPSQPEDIHQTSENNSQITFTNKNLNKQYSEKLIFKQGNQGNNQFHSFKNLKQNGLVGSYSRQSQTCSIAQWGEQGLSDIISIFGNNLDKILMQGRNLLDLRQNQQQRESKNNQNQSNNGTFKNFNMNEGRITGRGSNRHSHTHAKISRLDDKHKLTVLRKKEMMDFSSKMSKENRKNDRFNNSNPLNETPFSNIVQKFQKSLNLPSIKRPRVDAAKQQLIELKYKQLLQNKSRQFSQQKKVLSGQNLKVGQVLKEQIQKNIVVLVMGLIMIIPMITADTWFDQDSSLSITANLFVKQYEGLSTNQGAIDDLLESFVDIGLEMSTPLVHFTIPINSSCCWYPQNFSDKVPVSIVPIEELRLSEQVIIIDNNTTIIFSKKENTQISSYLNLSRSMFITLLLIFCSVLFMNDIENYALHPLEKMSTLINKISNNPFQALKQINQEKNKSSSDEQIGSSQKLIAKVKQQDDKKLQTNILSDVIIKITTLLTIGAGQIGSEIISQNIEQIGIQGKEDKGNITTIDGSNKVLTIGNNQEAVYAYIQFRQFQKICDAFGDKILKYINKVTSIIHEQTISFGGVPMQYDGKGFLLLWKLPKKNDKLNNMMGMSQLSFRSEQQAQLTKICVLAIQSVTKMILELNKLQETRRLFQYLMQKYSESSNQLLQGNVEAVTTKPTSFNKNSPIFHENYEPHLFVSSVHIGSSYYGSFGSNYKLECKCIGYDVSFTRWLANIVQQQGYGVNNIISEDVFILLEEYEGIVERLNLRKIDQIRIRQIRFKDKQQNPNLKYYHQIDLQNMKFIKNQKNSMIQLFTSDFQGKLQVLNTNESQILNLHPHAYENHSILIAHQNIVASSDHSKSKQLMISSLGINNSQNNYEGGVGQTGRTNSSQDQNTLMTYQIRDVWLELLEQSSIYELMNKLESSDPQILAARQMFEPEFYENWIDALDSYYSMEFTDSLSQFKYLHTYNHQFYDPVSRIFIKRIENTNIQQLMAEKERRMEMDEAKFRQELQRQGKILWDGYKEVIWKM